MTSFVEKNAVELRAAAVTLHFVYFNHVVLNSTGIAFFSFNLCLISSSPSLYTSTAGTGLVSLWKGLCCSSHAGPVRIGNYTYGLFLVLVKCIINKLKKTRYSLSSELPLHPLSAMKFVLKEIILIGQVGVG